MKWLRSDGAIRGWRIDDRRGRAFFLLLENIFLPQLLPRRLKPATRTQVAM